MPSQPATCGPEGCWHSLPAGAIVAAQNDPLYQVQCNGHFTFTRIRYSGPGFRGDGGRTPGQFYEAHSIATDSRGNIFVTETYEGKRVQKFVYRGMRPAPSGSLGVVRPD